MQLIVGRIPFLVCAPYFHASLDEVPEGVRFIDGPPSFQNQKLREGLVHLAPSSSFAYGQNPGLYGILPELCTGSSLEIRSVKLFSKVPWQELNNAQIHLTPQSSTSIHLLKLISQRFWKISPHWVIQPWGDVPCSARLLIGDEALLETAKANWEYTYDLASLWQEWHGLPFVFGIWIVHHSAWESPQLANSFATFRTHLSSSVEAFRKDPESALAHWMQHYPTELSLDFLQQYFQIVEYGFSDLHKKSLQLFLQLSAEEGLIPSAPPLRFL